MWKISSKRINAFVPRPTTTCAIQCCTLSKLFKAAQCLLYHCRRPDWCWFHRWLGRVLNTCFPPGIPQCLHQTNYVNVASENTLPKEIMALCQTLLLEQPVSNQYCTRSLPLIILHLVGDAYTVCRPLDWCAIQHFLSVAMSTRDTPMSWPMWIRHVEYAFRTILMVLCQTPQLPVSIQYCTTANLLFNKHREPSIPLTTSPMLSSVISTRDSTASWPMRIRHVERFSFPKTVMICVKTYDNRDSVQTCTPSNFFTNTLCRQFRRGVQFNIYLSWIVKFQVELYSVFANVNKTHGIDRFVTFFLCQM